MTSQHDNRQPNRADETIRSTLGRLGDTAEAPPSWGSLMERHRADRPRRRRYLPRFDWADLPLSARLVGAGLMLALGALVGGLLLSALLPGDGTNIESVDEAPDSVDTTVPTTIPGPERSRDDESDGIDAAESAVPVGCFGDPPLGLSDGLDVSESPAVTLAVDSDGDGQIDESVAGAGQADIDGDGLVDRITTASSINSDPPRVQVVAQLGSGSWIVSDLNLPTGDVPRFNPSWDHVDLDGNGDDELLGEIQANNFSRVMVFDLTDCAITPVPVDGPDLYGDGFPTMASSASCQDTCNVGLICHPSGGLTSFRSDAVDQADRYGMHNWTSIDWIYRDGTLSVVDEVSDVRPWDEISRLKPNSVTCISDSTGEQPVPEPVDPARLDAVETLADQLGLETMVATGKWWDEDALDEAYLVADGTVSVLNNHPGYRVVGASDNVLFTASPNSKWADGPMLDFNEQPILCPAGSERPDGTLWRTSFNDHVLPVQQDDGGWAVRVEGDEFGDPLPIADLEDGDWWEVPLWDVDCDTGERVRVPSVRGSAWPSLEPPGEGWEVFMDILNAGDTTLYVNGGEGFISVYRSDGSVLLSTTATSWFLTDDGSTLVVVGMTDEASAINTSTGDVLWTTDLNVGNGAHSWVQVRDRLIVTDDVLGSVGLIDALTGDVLADGTAIDGLLVAYLE